MNKERLALAFALLCYFVVATPTEVRIESQSGGMHKIDKNTLLTVVFEGNPSTGYSWYVDSKLTVLKLISTNSEPIGNIPQPKDSRMGVPAGAPVKVLLTFKALKPGTEKLVLRYYQVWEKKSDKDKIWKATVVVKKAPALAKPTKK